MGNDYQWDWCGRTAFSCKDTVSTARCPSGVAELDYKKGSGKCCSSVNINGCNYAYYAQYKCKDGAAPTMPPTFAPTPAPAPAPTSPPNQAVTVEEAKKQCGSLCLQSNYCCNNPDVGSNQYFSCSQACMVRYYGASQQECLTLVNTQAKQRGCSRSFGAHSFSFCQRCADLTPAPQCKWGVQNGEPSQKGCTLDIKASRRVAHCFGPTSPPPRPLLPPTLQ